ncbi:putative dna methylase n-6 adenine-specific conserved site [Diaporthe ampelina]|uniref:Putative dna methylase n-6 adenine-specific conserved site n=1 Tax=Diaporthe ampelina TaxID=1214573 RepID=A0A0G2H2W2_9PEZI|nr:putative dna methylase n-6 adenine-specific conserved site [Diaporthe ampelina]
MGLFSLMILAGAGSAMAHTSNVEVPASLPTRALGRDAVAYSVEPVWLDAFSNSSLMVTLLYGLSNLTGKATPIRIGGTTSDQTYIVESLPGNVTSLERTEPSTQWNITASWFSTFANYFPDGTEVIYCLNLADNSSNWNNTQEQASAVWDALGEKLVMFELGNEIDHFIDKGWRSASWGVAEYIKQFNNLTASIMNASWYAEAGDSAPKFQAAVFADPPWVADQQDEVDDFDIVNLTRGGLVDAEHEVVQSYSVHLYPQSTCDTERWLRMRLDLLSNHTALWLNVSQFVPQVAAADAANTSLVFGETNSVSCGGRSGISDTFGAALWAVDYVLMAASIGMPRVYFHLGAQSQYSAFTPWSYELNNETLLPGIRAPFYGHYFVAKVVEGLEEDESYGVAALPGANSSDLSGYAVYRGGGLAKLVFLDMGVWNGTEGLSNPSTLSSTDGTDFSSGTRPSYNMTVTSPWSAGQSVSIARLQGPGTNAKSSVNVSGVTFDPATGARVEGEAEEEVIQVGEGGAVSFHLTAAEGVLLQLVTDATTSPGSDEASRASFTVGCSWSVLLMVVAVAMSMAA